MFIKFFIVMPDCNYGIFVCTSVWRCLALWEPDASPCFCLRTCSRRHSGFKALWCISKDHNNCTRTTCMLYILYLFSAFFIQCICTFSISFKSCDSLFLHCRILMNGRVCSCLVAIWRMTLEARNNSCWFVFRVL